MTQSKECPVCKTPAILQAGGGKDGYWDRVSCTRCGDYCTSAADDLQMALSMDAFAISNTKDTPHSLNPLQDLCRAVAKCAFASKSKKDTTECRAIISHVLNMGSPVNRLLGPQDFTQILNSTYLPSPSEQADNLIKFLGETLAGMGDIYSISKEGDGIRKLGARIGTKIGTEWNDYYALVVALETQGFIAIDWDNGKTSGGKKVISSISLTLSGWNKYEALQRLSDGSKLAFVAMKFKRIDDKETDYFFQDILLPEHLMPAIKETGFRLSNPLADEPKAGNIHARLEVEIKNARFVVAELSHHNNGAYWEAGFAKGLSKPVIYMFNKEIAGHASPPHFDVGSDHIIFWDKKAPEQAARELRDIIRNTLFGEAIQNSHRA